MGGKERENACNHGLSMRPPRQRPPMASAGGKNAVILRKKVMGSTGSGFGPQPRHQIIPFINPDIESPSTATPPTPAHATTLRHPRATQQPCNDAPPPPCACSSPASAPAPRSVHAPRQTDKERFSWGGILERFDASGGVSSSSRWSRRRWERSGAAGRREWEKARSAGGGGRWALPPER